MRAKKGQVINWQSSDKDHGSVKLENDLAPGAWVEGLGHPGNGYTCTAAFNTNADLTVKSAAWGNTYNEVVVEIQNLNPWVDAGASVTKVEVMSCGNQVLATVNSAPMPLAKSATHKFSVSVPSTAGKRYLRVTTDAGSAVIEMNEQNNVWQNMGVCIS